MQSGSTHGVGCGVTQAMHRPDGLGKAKCWGKSNHNPSSKEMQIKNKNKHVLLSAPDQPISPVFVPADPARIHALFIPPKSLGAGANLDSNTRVERYHQNPTPANAWSEICISRLKPYILTHLFSVP